MIEEQGIEAVRLRAMGIRKDTGALNARFMPRPIVAQQNRSARGIGRKLYKTLCISVQGQHSGRAES